MKMKRIPKELPKIPDERLPTPTLIHRQYQVVIIQIQFPLEIENWGVNKTRLIQKASHFE